MLKKNSVDFYPKINFIKLIYLKLILIMREPNTYRCLDQAWQTHLIAVASCKCSIEIADL